MQWFQETYTQRFNARHGLCGHLFQGRYKSLPIENAPDYFTVVSSYIHLNPARAKLFNLEQGKLTDYPWSSYPLYLRPSRRPAWLEVGSVLSAFGVADDPAGRKHYREYMQKRVLEIADSKNPHDVDEKWDKIRRGWFFGAEAFRDELLEKIDESVTGYRRDSFSGDQVRMHDEAVAQTLLEKGLGKLGLTITELGQMQKGAPQKQVLAWYIRSQTIVSNEWLAQRLHCGHPSNLPAFIKNVKADKIAEIAHFKQILISKD